MFIYFENKSMSIYNNTQKIIFKIKFLFFALNFLFRLARVDTLPKFDLVLGKDMHNTMVVIEIVNG